MATEPTEKFTEEHRKILKSELSYRMRGCVYEVYRELGCGFLEKVYEQALVRELKLANQNVQQQVQFPIIYKDRNIGNYIADLVVNNEIIIEIKAAKSILPEHEAQLINYLTASKLRLGLIVNFAFPKAQVKRIVV